MGCFSWLDCKTGEPVYNRVPVNSYLLIPKEFGGGAMEEPCYDGYGHFKGKDVYEIVADWNKQQIPEIIKQMEAGEWTCRASEEDKRNMLHFYNGEPFEDVGEGAVFEKRYIGIMIACYNEDNERLRYPIKITHDVNAVYEECPPSKSDPEQGFPPVEEEMTEDEFYWQNNLLWDILRNHVGHKLEIAIYGDPENPANISLEDMDTNEVILDAGIYTVCAREDI